MIKNRDLTKYGIPALYAVAVLLLTVLVYLISAIFSMQTVAVIDDDFEYVSSSIFDDVQGVMSDVDNVVVSPYNSTNVTIYKDFYEYNSDESTQLKSIIYYGGTYMQNSGIDYTSSEAYDVVAVLDGEVIDVTEDKILGTIVQIKHSDNLISVYQGVSEVTVKEKDTITKGSSFAKSGKSAINKDNKNSLHFEIYMNNEVINPSNVIGKSIEELKGN